MERNLLREISPAPAPAGRTGCPRRFADGYRRMLVACLEDERAGLRRAAIDMGYVQPGERADWMEAVVDLIALGWEPFRSRGGYEFGRSDLAPRLREAGLHLAFDLGYCRPPPPETPFVHPKLAGTFLLCHRLGARVDLRSQAEQALSRV